MPVLLISIWLAPSTMLRKHLLDTLLKQSAENTVEFCFGLSTKIKADSPNVNRQYQLNTTTETKNCLVR